MKQRLIVFSVLAIVTGAVHSTELAVCIDDLKVRHIAQVSAVVESEGYCRWTRVEEACQFAKRMGFKKIGIAHCISFVDETLMMSQGKCDLQSKPM